MDITRRDLLQALGGAAALTAMRGLGAESSSPTAVTGFPRRQDFAIADGYTYINGAYTHPMPSARA